MTAIWIIVFIVSLVALVKGADWLLSSSERIGLAIGISPFVVGVVIVGVGTSLPELISSFFAIAKDATEIVTANAIGSNIANILLVVGFSAVVGKRLSIDKDLIDLELPLLAGSTAIFLAVIWDKVVTLPEALVLIAACVIYTLSIFFNKESDEMEKSDLLVKEAKKTRKKIIEKVNGEKEKRPSLRLKDFGILAIGAILLVFGAQYLIESVIQLSTIWNIATGVVAITAVAIGTSLPELIVSSKAALRGKSEMALGNIFGSNVFNILVVVGIPGLFKNLKLDDSTFLIGVPFLIIATLLFVISGISRRIHSWEGGFFLLIYIVFMAKLFGFF